MKLVFKGIKWLLGCGALFISLLLLFVFLALENAPSLPLSPKISFEESRQIKEMLLTSKHKLLVKHEDILFSQNNVKSIGKITNQAIGLILTQSDLRYDSIIFNASIPLAKTSFFINIHTKLINNKNKNGLVISSLKIGDLSLPANALLPAAEFILSKYLNIEYFQIFDQAMKSGQIEQQKLVIFAENLNQLNTSAKEMIKTTNISISAVDLKKINKIQKIINNTTSKFPKNKNIPLAKIASTVMKKTLPLINQNEQQWGKAYLWAMAINFANPSFRRLIGAKNLQTISPETSSLVTIKNRNDLVLHFFYSAILEQLTNGETSFAIGELKELKDAENGGSGFSFADLTADRAGIVFSHKISSQQTSWQTMLRLTQLKGESDFFPSIQTLKESISATDFLQNYQGKNSLKYQKELEHIDNEIQKLPLFK